jgi:hypothetical protein
LRREQVSRKKRNGETEKRRREEVEKKEKLPGKKRYETGPRQVMP